MQRLLRSMLGLGVFGAAAFIGLALWARSAPRPTNLGLADGHLLPCPATPNCVATELASPTQLMPPLTFTGTMAEAKARLIEIVRGLPRTTLVADQDTYLATEFRTPGIGFVDDVEFRFDASAKAIHFRSASRLGRHDLGVNRARMTALTQAWNSNAGARSSCRRSSRPPLCVAQKLPW